ncbi:hypothetical protein BGX38DRAFT_1146874 [Terfezia claveryi]|nr:hypothetical protein BGX38DRAFT_1146874 [Terfezia claveryi]
MPNRPEKKKTTGKAPTSPAPEPPMQKKRKTTLGAPASPVAKMPTTCIEHVPQKRKTRAELAHPIEDVPRRMTRAELALIPPPVEDVTTRGRTRAKLAFYPPLIADVPTRSMPRAELAELVPKNLYAKYADFLWGPRELNPDTEFSQGLEKAKEELAKGGTDDCLSDEDIGTDIEEDYDDKPNKEDDDEDTGLWGRWVASEGSSEEEAQSTESDSSKQGKVLSVPSGGRPAELLPSDTEDGDYRDSTEENNCEVNE